MFPYGTGGSLYLRPLLIGTGAQIGVAPGLEYAFIVLVVPVGPYYKGGLQPVKAIIYDEFDRAAPLGVGHVKVAGNYAASLFAHEKAKHEGYPVELYLDAKEHRYIEEFATSNFIGIKNNSYVTPDSPSILPSVTNKTLKQIATDLGMNVEVRPVPFEELGTFSEIAACGTAVVVTPVCEVRRGEQVIRVGSESGCGPVLQTLRNRPGHPIRRAPGHARLVLGNRITHHGRCDTQSRAAAASDDDDGAAVASIPELLQKADP